MTSLLDIWRGVDPTARLASGDVDGLDRAVRGVARTRAAPPHLPPLAAGGLLIVDGGIVAADGLGALLAAVRETELDPAGLWVVTDAPGRIEATSDALPVLAGAGSAAAVADCVAAYLADEGAALASLAAGLRLAAAEAALGDPTPAAPAGVVAARLRRGMAVDVGGALTALVPRPAGRALATRFAAGHGRLLAQGRGTPGGPRRLRDGLWVLGRPVTDGSVAWLFDDLPLARVDDVALDAVVVTLRALLRRPAGSSRSRAAVKQPPSSGDPLRDTLIAVARANGRVAPAARALGVHRNTVLYRLRRASAELGIDPRRPEDALRLLAEVGPRD